MIYKFLLTLPSESTATDYGNPIGWDSLSTSLTWDGKQWLPQFSGNLTYGNACCNGAYDAIYAAWLSNPCGEFTLIIQSKIDSLSPFTDFITAKFPAEKLEFDCFRQLVEFTLEDESGLTRLNENRSQEVCLNTPTAYKPTEVEICTQYSTGKPFYTFRQIFDEFQADFGVTISAPLFDVEFTPHKQRIFIPVSHSTTNFRVEIENELGDIFKATVTNTNGQGATSAPILANLLQQYVATTANLPASEWFGHRLASVSVNVLSLEVTSYSRITRFELFDNDVKLANSPSNVQEYRYGLKGLGISPKGLTGNKLCISWDELTGLLHSIFDINARSVAGTVVLDQPLNQFDITATPTISRTTAGDKFGHEPEAIVKEFQYGYEFETKDQAESLTNWTWNLPDEIEASVQKTTDQQLTTNSPIFFEDASTGGLFGAGTTWISNQRFVAQLAGTYTFTASVTVQDAALQYPSTLTLNYFVNGVLGTTKDGLGCTTNYIQGNPAVVTCTYCLNAGDEVELRVTAIEIENFFFAKANSTLAVTADTCAIQPEYEYENHDNIPYNSVLPTCKKVGEDRVSNQYITGVGFEFAQQLKGLSDYGDAYFISFLDETALTTKTFPFQVFRETDSCDCRNASTEQVCFYNIPIQRPHIANNHAGAFLGRLSHQAVTAEYTYDPTLAVGLQYTYTITDKSNTTFERTLDNVLISPPPVCLSPPEYTTLTSELIIDFDTCFPEDSAALKQVLKEITFQLASGQTEMKLYNALGLPTDYPLPETLLFEYVWDGIDLNNVVFADGSTDHPTGTVRQILNSGFGSSEAYLEVLVPDGFTDGVTYSRELFQLEPAGQSEKWLQVNGSFATLGINQNEPRTFYIVWEMGRFDGASTATTRLATFGSQDGAEYIGYSGSSLELNINGNVVASGIATYPTRHITIFVHDGTKLSIYNNGSTVYDANNVDFIGAIPTIFFSAPNALSARHNIRGAGLTGQALNPTQAASLYSELAARFLNINY